MEWRLLKCISNVFVRDSSFFSYCPKAYFVHLNMWTEGVSGGKGRGEERGSVKFGVIECP